MIHPLVPLRRIAWALALLCLPCPVTEAGDPEDAGAGARARGQAAFERAALDEAQRCFEQALRVNVLDGQARVGLARVLVAQTRPEEARQQLALAGITTTPVAPAHTHKVRASALLLLGRNHAAHDAIQAGLRADPFDASLVEVAAQVAFRLGDIDRAGTLYQRASALDPSLESANMRLGSGFGPAVNGTPWRESPQRGPFHAAVAAWAAADLPDAGERFQQLVVRWPESFKFRLGLGLVLREDRLAANVGNNTPERYRLLPAPDIAGIEAFIPQWVDLTDEARHVIRVAVAPAARWIPTLVEQGARHDILSFDALLTEDPDRNHYDRTFDGRRWRHLRGVGGAKAATGVEKLRLAARFSFNTFAHEFAHQLLTHGFDKAQWKTIQTLYLNALESNQTLDYYAASNIDEYFAQGYEAFISLHKNGRLRETARHTHEELRTRDPALFDFLARTLDGTHMTPQALKAFWAAGTRR